MESLKYMWLFVKAVFHHWGWLLSGSAAGIFAFSERAFLSKPLPAKAIIWIFGVFAICVSVFLAWRDQRLEVERLAELVDDRVRQQQMAAAYQPCLHTGHKISVKWSDAVLKKSDEGLLQSSAEGQTWYEMVSARLQIDFGPDVAKIFAYRASH